MKQIIPTEHQEQVRVIQHCNLKKILVFAIPNGANKSIQARNKFKAEGLIAGIPDLFFPIPKGEYHGLFLELKRIKGSTVSDEQKKWMSILFAQGYCVKLCYGADEAIREIESYLR